MPEPTAPPIAGPFGGRVVSVEPAVVIPPAVRWCNYAGDVRSTINPVPHGPNEMSEFLTPVEATYDPDTNTTRFGWTYQLLTQEQRDAVRARYAA